MNLDRTQAMRALSYLVMAFFVAGGVASARWRWPLKWTAFALYGLAMLLALVEVGLWLADK